jgi:hypothetical protein
MCNKRASYAIVTVTSLPSFLIWLETLSGPTDLFYLSLLTFYNDFSTKNEGLV